MLITLSSVRQQPIVLRIFIHFGVGSLHDSCRTNLRVVKIELMAVVLSSRAYISFLLMLSTITQRLS